jgi:hypothetical protein
VGLFRVDRICVANGIVTQQVISAACVCVAVPLLVETYFKVSEVKHEDCEVLQGKSFPFMYYRR